MSHCSGDAYTRSTGWGSRRTGVHCTHWRQKAASTCLSMSTATEWLLLPVLLYTGQSWPNTAGTSPQCDSQHFLIYRTSQQSNRSADRFTLQHYCIKSARWEQKLSFRTMQTDNVSLRWFVSLWKSKFCICVVAPNYLGPNKNGSDEPNTS